MQSNNFYSVNKNVRVVDLIPKKTGIGDVVYSIANPIAKAIDKIAGTKISSCEKCKKRREKLNEMFPFQKK